MPCKVVSCHCGKIIKSELNLAGFVGLDKTELKRKIVCMVTRKYQLYFHRKKGKGEYKKKQK